MGNQEDDARVSAAILIQRKLRPLLDRKRRLKFYKLQVKHAKEEISRWISQDEDDWIRQDEEDWNRQDEEEDARGGYDSGLFEKTSWNRTEVRTPRSSWD